MNELNLFILTLLLGAIFTVVILFIKNKTARNFKLKAYILKTKTPEVFRSLSFVEHNDFDKLKSFVPVKEHFAFDEENPEQKYVEFTIKDGILFEVDIYIESERFGVCDEVKEITIDFLSNIVKINPESVTEKNEEEISEIVVRKSHVEVSYTSTLCNASFERYFKRNNIGNWNYDWTL